ncbi:hypothetical protein BDR06DRAFT_967434 [Suillus hirtellus]|nr:hypothetical protein BDR06DRAFT_967434 [Suillus hirtellus]
MTTTAPPEKVRPHIVAISVRRVAGVANVGSLNAQIVSITTGRIAGVTSIVVGSLNTQVLSMAISSVAGVTSVTGVIRDTRSGGRSVERNAGETIVGSPSVQVLNVTVKQLGLLVRYKFLQEILIPDGVGYATTITIKERNVLKTSEGYMTVLMGKHNSLIRYDNEPDLSYTLVMFELKDALKVLRKIQMLKKGMFHDHFDGSASLWQCR